MGGFVKLYSSILESSIWTEDSDTRIVWITMLAMADSQGYVDAAVSGLARRANVSLPKCKEALSKLEAPDEYSKSAAYAGRRIQKVERGWIILNYQEYRERRDTTGKDGRKSYVYYARDKDQVKIGVSQNPWARLREFETARPGIMLAAIEPGDHGLEADRHRQFAKDCVGGEWFLWSPEIEALVVEIRKRHSMHKTIGTYEDYARSARSQSRSYDSVSVSPSESGKVNKDGSPFCGTPDATDLRDQDFLVAWGRYPKRDGTNSRANAWKAWAMRVREGATASDLIAGVDRYAAWIRARGVEKTRFVMQAQTFFGPGEHWKESYDLAEPPTRNGGNGKHEPVAEPFHEFTAWDD